MRKIIELLSFFPPLIGGEIKLIFFNLAETINQAL